MKVIYRFFLFFMLSSNLSAFNMTCPYGCDTDPERYWDKQYALQDFLYEIYPQRICQLHFFTIYL